ncbi:hypothetical protein [Pseudobacillus wudalianchiensis]|uniref:Uncharacterized protein n=1 Tax=Pseudobacillus wudalianchiensis TaxID=1743143 RepID=A0A1B9ATU3_9BACI|nr:hypothetical protein [Bacillus wudalianchiensis]OCA87297.1 hypothetical protein A8F95_08600 [Bacillus wudalianchiensis]
MYVFTDVDTYLFSLAYTEQYQEFDVLEREKRVFTAYELLTTYYPADILTPKIIALQTKYMIEGEEDEYAKYKRQGIKSLGVKGISLSFDDKSTAIAPDVIALIEQTNTSGGAFVGRLI